MVPVRERRTAARATGNFAGRFDRSIRVQKQNVDRAAIGCRTASTGVIKQRSHSEIGHAVSVEVADRRCRNAERVAHAGDRPAVASGGDFPKAVDGTLAAAGDRKRVVLDFAADCAASRLLPRGGSTQSKAGIRRAFRAGRNRGECQCETAIGRPCRYGDLSSLARVAEDAVPVVVDPAGQSCGAACRVRHEECHLRSRSHSADQVERAEHAVLVVGPDSVDVVRVGSRVLLRSVVRIDRVSQKQPGHDGVVRSAVDGRRPVVAGPGSDSCVRSIAVIIRKARRIRVEHVRRVIKIQRIAHVSPADDRDEFLFTD